MPDYRVIAIDSELATAVRTTERSPGYGHPVHRELAKGYGPCRQCLRDFTVGVDERLLFTHDSFAGRERLPQPGPVFIHAEECVRYFEDGGFPEDLRAHALTFEGFAAGRHLLAQEYVTDGRVEGVISRLFGDERIDYLQVRDTSAGCYDFRIERTLPASAPPDSEARD
jgi:hypothetical protein